MIFSVSDKVRAKCLEYDVDISPDARFIIADEPAFAVEGPAIIRGGLFDIDLVGGFTYMGDYPIAQGSNWRRVNFVGRFCSIAGRVTVGQNEHPTDWVSGHWMFLDDLPWKEAKAFRYRFDHEAIGELLRLQWWNYGLSALDGATIKDIDFALSQIDRNIQSGHAEPYSGPILRIAQDTVDVISADAEAGTLAD